MARLDPVGASRDSANRSLSQRTLAVRSLISHLVAASLALHTLLGCCVHHAHAETAHLGSLCTTCDQTSHDHESHAPAADHDHDADCDHARHVEADHDHDAADVDGELLIGATDYDDHGAPCSGSCGEKCQFVTIEQVQLESPTALFDVAIMPVDAIELAAEMPRLRGEVWLTAPPALPVRLHLWIGLLLI